MSNEALGYCCYGGPPKPKSACGSCGAWKPVLTGVTVEQVQFAIREAELRGMERAAELVESHVAPTARGLMTNHFVQGCEESAVLKSPVYARRGRERRSSKSPIHVESVGTRTQRSNVSEIETLADALPKQQARCRNLLTIYKELGPTGAFGALMIEQALQRADRAAMSGDVVQMLSAYAELKDLE